MEGPEGPEGPEQKLASGGWFGDWYLVDLCVGLEYQSG